jgi:hypothetical protein
MAEPHVVFQRRVAGACVEISGQVEHPLASVIYPYPDPQFEQGGMDVVLLVVASLVEMFHEETGNDAFFLSSLGFHAGPEHQAALEALVTELDERQQARPTAELGGYEQIGGVWMPAADAVALLREIAPRCSAVIAEESEARFLLLDRREDEGSGWDIVHSDGMTIVGRWDGNLSEGMPGRLEPGELARVERLLIRLATEVLPALLSGRVEA